MVAGLEGVGAAGDGDGEQAVVAGAGDLAGGGAANPAWRRLLADVLGKRLRVAGSPAGAARGAALLAGVAAGIYGSVEETAGLGPEWEVAAEPGPEAATYSTLRRPAQAASST